MSLLPRVLSMAGESDEQSELNRGHYFEYLDRVHIAESFIEMSLGDHPMLDHYPSLRLQYDQVINILASMYQEVGRLEDTWE